MLLFLIWLVIIGAIAGYLARLLVPGPDPMGFLATVALGVAGSFIGGFLGYLLFHRNASEGPLQPGGIVGSVIGAILLLLILRTSRRSRSRS